MSLLPASIKKIRSKQPTISGNTGFHVKTHGSCLSLQTMEAICCHGTQSSDAIQIKTQCCLSPTQNILQIIFDCDLPADRRDIDASMCRLTDGNTDGCRLDCYPMPKDLKRTSRYGTMFYYTTRIPTAYEMITCHSDVKY